MKPTKYRIKIYTFQNGRKEYCPQVKKGFFYYGILYNGEATIENYSYNNRDRALEIIDLHLAGNKKVINIEFEYINK